jgi:hypothetical protein
MTPGRRCHHRAQSRNPTVQSCTYVQWDVEPGRWPGLPHRFLTRGLGPGDGGFRTRGCKPLYPGSYSDRSQEPSSSRWAASAVGK